MTIDVAETIRKAMGWCPNTTMTRKKTSELIDLENMETGSLGAANADIVQAGKVLFPANTTVFLLFSISILNVILALFRGMDHTTIIAASIGTFLLFCYLAIRSLQSDISIDEHGVHLHSFELRDITIEYKDIRSVTFGKPAKFATSMISLLAFPLLMISLLAVYSAFIEGDWQITMLLFPIIPGYLLLKQRGDAKYRDVDTQLSIQCENKSRFSKWYEATSHYAIATDKVTASMLQDRIEHYRSER